MSSLKIHWWLNRETRRVACGRWTYGFGVLSLVFGSLKEQARCKKCHKQFQERKKK